MKVFFSCSTKEILKYKKFYKTIRDTIKASGHTLTRDWLDWSIARSEAKQNDTPRGVRVYFKVMSAILAADVVILEGTVRSTTIGYQLTFALQKGKPVLFLTQTPQNKLRKLFIGGVKSPLLTLKSYNKNNLTQIVKDYLVNVEKGTRIRFNLVLDKSLDNYIEWAAFTYKKSKTEIIKNAIEKKIKKDKRYQKYLNS